MFKQRREVNTKMAFVNVLIFYIMKYFHYVLSQWFPNSVVDLIGAVQVDSR